MEEIVNLILESSVTIIVIAYFMYRDFKFMTKQGDTLQALLDTVTVLKDLIIKEEKE